MKTTKKMGGRKNRQKKRVSKSVEKHDPTEYSDSGSDSDGYDESETVEPSSEERNSGLADEDDSGSQGSDSEMDVGSDENSDEFVQHKKALCKLKETDPDFYKYLEENDRKLLEFVSDDSDSDGEEDDKLHRPPDALEGDSEESDFEPEKGDKDSKRSLTLATVKKWKENLINEPGVGSITAVIKGFNAALARVKGEETTEYKVVGSSVFNAVVEVCVMDLETAITKFLKLPKGTVKQPQKTKKWVKIRVIVKSYLSDLLELLSGVTSNHIISVLLKHLHGICYLVVCFNKLSKNCLKLMSTMWSSAEESIRVLAYLCILRLTTCFSDSKGNLLNSALKILYISYVKNTRFVSANTLPQINFMRRSLADLFSINPSLSYRHAFVYIRQLAIHLRNAVTVRKKEHFQTVYNWQYVNSLHLWVELLCLKKDKLDELAYPLITITTGCIKIIPTAQYVPLRFHCLNMLVKLSRATDMYIPILPYILETFTVVNLNMKHKKASMKPYDFTCVLRLSKGVMADSAFTDAVIENVYQLLIETSYNHHNSISFPDLMVPVLVAVRSFIKNCKVTKYTSTFKPLLSKIEENSKFITNERNRLSVNLMETEKIKAFEANINLKGTPLSKFWAQWSAAKASKRPVKVEEKKVKDVKEVEEQIFTIRKDLKQKPRSGSPTELFPSDGESDQEISTLLCGPPEEDYSDMETDDPPTIVKQKIASNINDDAEETSKEIRGSDDEEDIIEELNISSF